MKKNLSILILFPFLCFSFPDPLETIDITHYSFTIELNDSTDVISGYAEVSLLCKKGINDFELDLIGKNNEGKGMQVNTVTLNGSSLKFTHQNNKIKIFLSNQASANDTFTVVISYSGIPKDGLIISKNKYGDRTFFADNWPDRGRNWLPIVDHPLDKASVDFIVVAPLHYEVVSNGIKVEESFLNKRQKITRYREETPIPTKVMVIGAARFAIQRAGVVGQIPVETWVYPQNRQEGFYDFAAATKVLDFYITHVGPYSYKKLANVQSKTIFGGLENASAIFYSENSVNGKANHESLIAHEIAHQWFGNSATEKEWYDIWLSEGFATYFALLYIEYTQGVDKRKEEMKIDRDQVITFFKKDPVPVVNRTITDWMKLLNVNSYQKGSWVLHMLRQEIGDQKFWVGIREYYRRYQNSNASTQDLRRVMEEASSQNLDQFFNQWIFKAGHPVIDMTWNYNENSKNLEITVNQIQKGSVFNFSLEIGIFANGAESPTIEKIKVDKQSNKFSIPFPSKPAKIELDPAINLLFESNSRN